MPVVPVPEVAAESPRFLVHDNFVADVYGALRRRFFNVCENHNLLRESVRIKARVLDSEEAIGKPEADEIPL